MPSFRSHIQAIVLLPFFVVVIVPFLLLYFSGGNTSGFDNLFTTLSGVILILLGISLMGITIRLFNKVGEGTLAPWAPPQKLVIRGPYQYVRNPMISGVHLVLLGEALLFQSGIILLWSVLFFTANHVYFIRKEEPDLMRRFGEAYKEYMQHVPRWIPRLTPWKNDELPAN